MSDEPTVELPHRAVLCLVHGEFFRDEYPRGVPIFTVRAFEAAVATDEIIDAAGGDTHKLNGVIAEFGPLCRIITPTACLEILRSVAETKGYETPWLSPGRCLACSQQREETRPYGFTAPGPRGGTLTVGGRMCVECIAHAPCQTS